MRWNYGLGALLLGMVAVLVACGGESPQAPNESGSGLVGRAAPVLGPMAPSFSVSTGGGSTFSSDEHSGEVLILYFSFAG